MLCPKCGFDASGEAQCARCGVVFSKLGRRSPRAVSSRVPSVSSKRPLFSRGFLWTMALLVTLVGSGIAFLVSLPRSPAAYGLFPLDETTVTAGAVENAMAVANEHPDVPILRDYVGRAHLLLALRYSNERHFEEAATALGEAERWGAPPGDVAAFRAFVLRNQGLWDAAAESAARAVGLGARTNPAEMHHIIGKARFYREDLPGAIEELEKALALRNRPAIRASLDKARRDAAIAGGFARLTIPHFVVRYDPRTMEAPSRLAVEALETSYQALVSEMGFEPAEPIAVVLYTREDYLAVGGDHEATGLYDGKIRVSVADIASKEAWIRETLRHELAHAFIRARAANHVPRWLNEGVAEYVTGARTRDFTTRLKTPVEEGSLARCVVDEDCDRASFYRAAASMVDYLVEFRGMVGIRDVLDALRRGQPIDAALERVFGADERGLAHEWEGYVRRRVD